MIASKNTQSDGTAAPRLLDVLREALRGAYSLPTEAVHQLDAALALSPSSVPNWPAHDTAIECRLCFRPQPMISMKSTGHFGRSVDTKVIKSKGRKPSGCGLHSFGVEQVLLGPSGPSCQRHKYLFEAGC
jgi:hypothetical protein